LVCVRPITGWATRAAAVGCGGAAAVAPRSLWLVSMVRFSAAHLIVCVLFALTSGFSLSPVAGPAKMQPSAIQSIAMKQPGANGRRPKRSSRKASSRTNSTGKGFGSAARSRLRKAGPMLPAGTVVKHGTSSDVLKQILKEGVRPSGSVSAGFARDAFEVRPTSDAVYVSSSYVAYAAALISFSSKMSTQVTTGFSLDPELVPLPVVLNIRLQEDCVLGPDEDYLKLAKRHGYIESKNGDVVEELWRKFGSGAILRDGGLPADWIESVECPHVPSALCLERAYGLGMMDPQYKSHGPWLAMPASYSVIASMREALEELGCSSADLLDDRESLKLMVDDVFKLIHAYALTETDDKAIKTHASIEKFESDDGTGVAYVTPLLSGPFDFGRRSWMDSETQHGRSIGITLSGIPPDWDLLNPDDPRLTYFDPSLDESRTEKMARLKAGYACLLWDCIRFFLKALKLQGSNREGMALDMMRGALKNMFR